MLVGLPAGVLLLALEIAARGGFKLTGTPVPSWAIVETICVLASLGLLAACSAQAAQRRADGWQDFAGPSPFVLIATQQAIVTALGLPLSAALDQFDVSTDSAVGLLFVVPLYLATYFGLVYAFGVRTRALTWSDVVHPRRLSPDLGDWTPVALAERIGWRAPTSRLRRWLKGPLGDFLLAACCLVPVMIATGLTNVVLLTVLGLGQTDLQSEVPANPGLIEKLITLVAIAVAIPIGEEVFFRGYTTNAWARSMNRNQALLRAALFFAFIHVINTDNTDAWLSLRAAAFNFGARVPVALVLCWLYLRRRSLVASVSLHGLYNGLIVLLSIVVTT